MLVSKVATWVAVSWVGAVEQAVSAAAAVVVVVEVLVLVLPPPLLLAEDVAAPAASAIAEALETEAEGMGVDLGDAAAATNSVDVLISSLTTMSRPREVNVRSPSSLSHLEN